MDCKTSGNYTCTSQSIWFPQNVAGTKKSLIYGRDDSFGDGGRAAQLFYALNGWLDVDINYGGTYQYHGGIMYCNIGFVESCPFAPNRWRCGTSGDDCNHPVLLSSSDPTPAPTSNPTPTPTHIPIQSPTSNQTPAPTSNPTPSPTFQPSQVPTSIPTSAPTSNPSPSPTTYPTSSPTNNPTPSPTNNPTPAPTSNPSPSPTNNPSPSPTNNPTPAPTSYPTSSPSNNPTSNPAPDPTVNPTDIKTTIFNNGDQIDIGNQNEIGIGNDDESAFTVIIISIIVGVLVTFCMIGFVVYKNKINEKIKNETITIQTDATIKTTDHGEEEDDDDIIGIIDLQRDKHVATNNIYNIDKSNGDNIQQIVVSNDNIISVEGVGNDQSEHSEILYKLQLSSITPETASTNWDKIRKSMDSEILYDNNHQITTFSPDHPEQSHNKNDNEISSDDDSIFNTTSPITTGGGRSIGDNHNEYEWIESALKQCDEIEWMQYIDNFRKQKVTDCRLKHIINDDILNQLIPEIGVRFEFKALYDNKQKLTDHI